MSRLLMCARMNIGRMDLKLLSLQNQHALNVTCLESPALQSLNHSKFRKFHNGNNVLRQQRKSATSSLTESSSSSTAPSTSVKEKVKETTTTAWYSSVIIAGVGVTAFILYYILNELFSKDSANNVYAAALNRCLKETKVVDLLGEPIKGFGEETRRGRRGHVSHLIYEKDGVNYMRMKFYLKGSRKQATVHLEMKESPTSGHFDYRYLFVQVDDLSRQIVILEDNRSAMESNAAAAVSLPAFGQDLSTSFATR
ncbi:hypothetical protein B566_EDAN001125 [Ephemera danica]|nr:hypothetical protein B566_EDAN001125 [Ephemera danica]